MLLLKHGHLENKATVAVFFQDYKARRFKDMALNPCILHNAY